MIRGNRTAHYLNALTVLVRASSMPSDYTIVMEHPTDKNTWGQMFDYSFHPRYSMPCYGELRKYKRTHPEDYTSSENKPTDLHYPFPEGHPAALGLNLPPSEKNEEVYKDLFSNESPFINGFRSKDNVLFIRKESGVPGPIIGFVVKDLEIDPTVLVNLLKFTRYNLALPYSRLREAGATIQEALGIIYLNNGMDPMYSTNKNSGYWTPAIFSAKRWFSQNPIDLSGGTLADRFDYNRTRMADPFYSKTGIKWYDEMSQRIVIDTKRWAGDGKGDVNSPTKILEAARDIFKKCLDQEEEPSSEGLKRLLPKLQDQKIYPTKNPALLAKMKLIKKNDVAGDIDIPDAA